MKSSFMKLNHVSTFSGEGQLEMLYRRVEIEKQDYRRDCRKTLNRVFSDTKVVDFTICEFSKIVTFGAFFDSLGRNPQKQKTEP